VWAAPSEYHTNALIRTMSASRAIQGLGYEGSSNRRVPIEFVPFLFERKRASAQRQNAPRLQLESRRKDSGLPVAVKGIRCLTVTAVALVQTDEYSSIFDFELSSLFPCKDHGRTKAPRNRYRAIRISKTISCLCHFSNTKPPPIVHIPKPHRPHRHQYLKLPLIEFPLHRHPLC